MNKKNKITVPTVKPRNPVAGSMQQSGAGIHKDKKAAMKRGETKHKKTEYFEDLDRRLNKNLKEFQDRMAGVGMGDYRPSESFDGGGEYNDEVGMVKNNLITMVHAIKELLEILKTNENLPEWVEEKISISKSMLITAKDYMLSQHASGEIYTMEAKSATKVLRIGDEWQVHIDNKIVRIPADEASSREEAIEQAKHNLGINEGWGKALLGTAALIASITGINHMQAQHLMRSDPQLAKLAQFRERAVKLGDEEKVKELDHRIQVTLDHLRITGDEVRDDSGKPIDPIYEADSTPIGYEVVCKPTGKVVGRAKTRQRARTILDKKDNEYGSYAHTIRPVYGEPVNEWTHDSLAAKLFEQELTYEDQLMGNLNRKLKR
jgi:hypothetical protein